MTPTAVNLSNSAITFSGSPIIFSGANAATMVLSGVNNDLTVGSGGVTIQNQITGAGALTKLGTGTLFLTNTGTASSNTGIINLNAGIINAQANAALGGAGGFVIAPNTALQLQGGISLTTAKTFAINSQGYFATVLSATVTSGGTGYTQAPTVTFSAGAYWRHDCHGHCYVISGHHPRCYQRRRLHVCPDGHHLGWRRRCATATANIYGGLVTSITITNAGSGYTSFPSVTLGTVSGATAATLGTVTGTVTGIAITNAGSGYTAAPNITFASGGGSGAAASAIGTTGAIENLSGSNSLAASGITLVGETTLGVDVGTLTSTGVIGGAFDLTKGGGGTLSLTGANTYVGTTNIAAGITSIGTSAGALGLITGGVVVTSGATLQAAGTFERIPPHPQRDGFRPSCFGVARAHRLRWNTPGLAPGPAISISPALPRSLRRPP